MNVRAGLRESILQTHKTKFFEYSMGIGTPEPPPLSTQVVKWL